MTTQRERRDYAMSIIYNMTQNEFISELESNQLPDFIRATEKDNDFFLTYIPNDSGDPEKKAYENRFQLRRLSVQEFVYLYFVCEKPQMCLEENKLNITYV
jgi:hypothetical protein